MTVDLVSLAIIALVAAACPIVAKLIPNKLVPETVFCSSPERCWGRT